MNAPILKIFTPCHFTVCVLMFATSANAQVEWECSPAVQRPNHEGSILIGKWGAKDDGYHMQIQTSVSFPVVHAKSAEFLVSEEKDEKSLTLSSEFEQANLSICRTEVPLNCDATLTWKGTKTDWKCKGSLGSQHPVPEFEVSPFIGTFVVGSEKGCAILKRKAGEKITVGKLVYRAGWSSLTFGYKERKPTDIMIGAGKRRVGAGPGGNVEEEWSSTQENGVLTVKSKISGIAVLPEPGPVNSTRITELTRIEGGFQIRRTIVGSGDESSTTSECTLLRMKE